MGDFQSIEVQDDTGVRCTCIKHMKGQSNLQKGIAKGTSKIFERMQKGIAKRGRERWSESESESKRQRERVRETQSSRQQPVAQIHRLI